MKIRLTVTLNVHRPEWELMYGTQDNLRRDVEDHVRNLLWGMEPREAGAVADITINGK